MDEKLREIIEKKIEDTLAKKDEVKKIIDSLNEISSKSDSFSLGIVIGRLYNSFYYQSRRILQREPTSQEFLEFLNILKMRQKDFLEKFQ
jgi:hypothetical protein